MKEKAAELLAKQLSLKKEDILLHIETPPTPSLGDYAFPCFNLSKELKKSPSDISKDISRTLKSRYFERIESNGPYINFFINRNALAKEILEKILKEKGAYGSGSLKEKVVIEFLSPNTNKPLHIGHARNIILGQAISNILSFMGNEVHFVNLYNDRGVHICKSMVAYDLFGNKTNPEKSKKKPDHFVGDFYVRFSEEFKKDSKLEVIAQEYLKRWEKGDKKILLLWKKMNSWAVQGFKQTYKLFGLNIEKNYYESKIYNKGKEIIEEGIKKGVVKRKPDGALYIDLSEEGLGEKILLRSDGTSIYITQDVYLALLKYKEFHFDKSIIISATEQRHHFKVLSSVLNKLGYQREAKSIHLDYGMVNLESGRMKSREGKVVDTDDLIEEMKFLAAEEISSRHKKISKTEKNKRAQTITLAALRYYFLKVERIKGLTFKPRESLRFDGDTGPYLLYTYSRAKSIISNLKRNSNISINSPIHDKEKEILLQLSNFPSAVFQAYNSLSPNIIANYAFHLAQTFNQFYHNEKVLGSSQERFRGSLVKAVAQVLCNSFYLLNMSYLEKM